MISRRGLILGAPAALLQAGPPNPVGCQNNAWKTDPADFEAFLGVLSRIKRIGYEGFEANVRFVQSQSGRVREARAQIEQTGLRFMGSHTGMTPEPEGLEPLIEISASFGAERLVLSGTGLFEDGRLDAGKLKAKAAYLNRTGEFCRQHGMRFTYHNHQGEFHGGSVEMEELLKQADPRNLSLMLDIGHAYLAGASVPEFVARHHERIGGLHFRDLKNGEQVPLGQGELDLDALAAIIRKTNWPGLLIVEEYLRTTDFAWADSATTSDRDYLRKMFAS